MPSRSCAVDGGATSIPSGSGLSCTFGDLKGRRDQSVVLSAKMVAVGTHGKVVWADIPLTG